MQIKTKSLSWTGCFAKFQSKNFFKIQEYPRVDDLEGNNTLHGV